MASIHELGLTFRFAETNFVAVYSPVIIFTWISSVCSWRVVKNEDTGEVSADGREILGVGAKVEGAVLSVVSSVEHPSSSVQLVSHRLPVYLHAGREHHQLKPLSNLKQSVFSFSFSFLVSKSMFQRLENFKFYTKQEVANFVLILK